MERSEDGFQNNQGISLDYKDGDSFNGFAGRVAHCRSAAVGSYWMSNQNDRNAFNASQGLGGMAMSLAWILIQVFFVILIIIVIYMAVTRVKTWIEKYLDAMLGKLDTLTDQKADREHAGAGLAVMNEKVERIEKKLDNIERILEKVAE